MNYLPEKTIKYKTYIKTALVESLRPVFQNHVDEKLRNANVTIDMPKERQSFPSIVVRFYENEILNAGVGHEEKVNSAKVQTIEILNATGGTFTLSFNGETTDTINYDASAENLKSKLTELDVIDSEDITVTGDAGGPYVITFSDTFALSDKYPQIVEFINADTDLLVPGNAQINITGEVYKFKHYFYRGDIELMISTLSSLDRDLIADTLVQTIAMGDLAEYTNSFFNRIYPPDSDALPDSIGHFININTDRITGINESTAAVPWNAENDLNYMVSYRINVWGEFYSLPPEAPYGYISKIFLYPYIMGETPPEGIPTGGEWI